MVKQVIIVYGPQGCGKTRNAEKLREALGLPFVREFDDYLNYDEVRGRPLDVNVLYLTNIDPSILRQIVKQECRFLPFDEVMQRACK